MAALSVCVLVPSVLSLTALSTNAAALLAALLALVAATTLLPAPRPSRHRAAPSAANTATSPPAAIPSALSSSLSVSPTAFVSLYRCGLLLSTAVAILGVDFVVFPRRLAKTEQLGVSPMDAGVGGFMFAAALTAPVARRLSFSPSLLDSVRRQLPVLALGGLRLLVVKLANYQEHVTEYGLHWNFFFTLAAGRSPPQPSTAQHSHSTASQRLISMSPSLTLSLLGCCLRCSCGVCSERAERRLLPAAVSARLWRTGLRAVVHSPVGAVTRRAERVHTARPPLHVARAEQRGSGQRGGLPGAVSHRAATRTRNDEADRTGRRTHTALARWRGEAAGRSFIR